MKRRKDITDKIPDIPLVFPAESIVLPELGNVFADPFGSYTGVAADPNENPVQDADDL